ncbi:MAG: hypothetical protein UIB39_01915, partial [Lachnospiraceae bacterium]|nr:hypothetical protein [Lachnospiraceae bacterium]
MKNIESDSLSRKTSEGCDPGGIDSESRREYKEIPDEELIGMIRDGDRQAMDFLMDKYKDMVKSRARSMFILGGDSQDLIQE